MIYEEYKMKKYFFNNLGSTLILLVTTIAVTAMLGTSLLAVTMMNYKLKKDNTAIKQAVYLSEAGLNNTYGKAYDLVEYSIKDSIKKSQDYLEIHNFNEEEAEELFYNSYKFNIIGNIDNILTSNSNLIIKIISPIQLSFIEGCLRLKLQSNYKINNVSQLVRVDMMIMAPNYSDVLLNTVEVLDLVNFENWFFSGEEYE
jgi:hypothetical protein